MLFTGRGVSQTKTLLVSNNIQYRSSNSQIRLQLLCSTYRSPSGQSYISGLFPAENQDHSVFEVAFDDYIYTKLDTHGRGAICIIYPSLAKSQFTLERWKQEEKAGAGSHHLVETGWVDQGPNSAPGHSQGNQSPAPAATLISTLTSSSLGGQQQLATRSRIRAIAFDALVIFDLSIFAKCG